MTEEKKEEIKKEDVKPAAAQTPAPAAEAKAPQDVKAAAEVKPQAPAEKVKKEKPSNCAGCNKSIKNKRWYYRSGKFYCTKRCWKTASKKEVKAPEAAAPEKK